MTTPGYGTGYGTGYGGGGGIPLAVSPFDVFCFSHCVDMFNILSDPAVSTVGNGNQFIPNGVTCDLDLRSGTGSPVPDTDADLIVTQPVPNTWTIEWTAIFHNLPTDFTDVVNRHIFVGATDASGPCAGLFVSKGGLMYLGAVHHVAGDIIIDSTTQVIPGSALYITEGEYITFRMSVSGLTGAVYLFVTKTADIPVTGQVLRAVLPTIDASVLAFTPTDRAIVSVRGDVVQPTLLGLDQFCMSSAVLIPNLKPVADAGNDQAVRNCSIVQLDGSASFDPEGAPVNYQWRLVDTPLGSSFAIEGGDGFTKVGVGGFTDKFFSDQVLGPIDVLDPILAGDVLLVDGVAHTIIGTGTDGGPNFFVQLGSFVLSELVVGQQFKVLRQRGMSNPTSLNPTFFPDVVGFYKFDLVVNDGALSSTSSVTIVNVLESALPRGCTPDLTFLFNYLSDFWNLVDDRDRISVFWGSLAQIAATELFTLWQYEYSKSHRDIQRTFVRRWLHYDLMLAEPIPELTNVRAFFGGVTSSGFLLGGLSGVSGTTLVISSPVLDADVSVVFGVLTPITLQSFAGELEAKLQNLADERFTTHIIDDRNAVASTGTYVSVAQQDYTDGQTFTLDDGQNPPVTFEIDKAGDGVSPGNVSIDISLVLPLSLIGNSVLFAVNDQQALGNLSITSSTVDVTTIGFTHDDAGEAGNRPITTAGSIPGTFTGMSGGSGGDLVRIDAPFPFTVAEGTTIPQFTIGDEGRTPWGTGGAGVAQKTYKVPISLEGLDIQEDDFLVLDGFAHRISTILDEPGDQFPYQRLVVKQLLPTAPVSTWALSGWVSSELLDFYNGLVTLGDHIDFEVSEISDENTPITARRDIVETIILGVNDELPSRAAFDAWPIGDELADSTLQVLLARVVRRTYLPLSDLVTDIPTLQRLIVIEDDEETLRRNVDFFLEELRGGFGIRFVSGRTGDPADVWEGSRPPNRLWSEYTYLDNRPLIEANFGLAVDLTVDQLEDLPENIDYLSAVRGLWHSFYNGPTIRNLRVGAQILLGLPFAETQGTIVEIRTDFGPSLGRILIQDTVNEEITRSYDFPRSLPVEVNPVTGVQYVVGDVVEEFAPLVEGVEVLDYITNPEWFEGFINQGIFYEVEKFHKFVVRVDKAAFNLSALVFVRNFILKIKPTYTFPLFLVLQEVGDTEVSAVDQTDRRGVLTLFDMPCGGNFGSAPMYDQGRPAGGGWRNQWDEDSTINAHLRSVLLYDDDVGSFTSFVDEAADSTVDDVPLLPAIGDIDVGDALYLGFDYLPDEVEFNISTAGIGAWALTWEYYDVGSSSYVALSGVVDGTTDFKTGGVNSLAFTRPSGLGRTQVSGSAPLFFIRGRVTTGVGAAGITRPLGTTITVAGIYATADFPTAESPVTWAYDKTFICPDDEVVVQRSVTFGAPTVITFDTVFAFGTPIQEKHEFEDTPPASPVPAGPAGLSLSSTLSGTAGFTGNLVQLRFMVLGDPGVDATDYEVVIDINGSPVEVTAFTMGVNTEVVATFSHAITLADTVAVRLRPATGGARSPNLTRVRAQVLQQDVATWNFGDTVPAGTYTLETIV